jgi:hypothetical protein
MLREFEAQRKFPFVLQTAQVHLAISDAECLQSFVVYDFLTSHCFNSLWEPLQRLGVTGRGGSLAYLADGAIRT